MHFFRNAFWLKRIVFYWLVLFVLVTLLWQIYNFAKELGTISEPRVTCNCSKRLANLHFTPKRDVRRSTCSNEATALGAGQKVISFAFFDDLGSKKTKYSIGHWENLLGMRRYYPGWVMRIYSDYSLHPDDEYCIFICDNSDVFWCDVTHIPNLGLNPTADLVPRSWRFLAYGDPLVDIMLSRDMDSRISMREAAAVNEWINSSKVFHSMRDNVDHGGVSMLAGMWGAKTHLIDQNQRRNTLQEFVKASASRPYSTGQDQNILRRVLYRPKNRNMFMAHDRFFCKRFPRILCKDFPTPYDGTHFVGSIFSP